MRRYLIPGVCTALLALFLSSCEFPPWNCLKGNGVVVLEERDFTSSPFTGIVSEGAYDITIIIDTVHKVFIDTDENLLEYISTYIRGDNLIIENERNRCLRPRDGGEVIIYIHMPAVHLINLVGSGIIYCEDFVYVDYIRMEMIGSGVIELRDLDVLSLDAMITGSGEIELWGICNEGDIDISGSGVIKAFHLEQDICDASISGSGDIYVFVYDILSCNISGSGNIFYRGNPTVTVRKTGTGEVYNSNK